MNIPPTMQIIQGSTSIDTKNVLDLPHPLNLDICLIVVSKLHVRSLQTLEWVSKSFKHLMVLDLARRINHEELVILQFSGFYDLFSEKHHSLITKLNVVNDAWGDKIALFKKNHTFKFMQQQIRPLA